MPRIDSVAVELPDGLTHRERAGELRARALQLTDDAYRADAPWQLRDVALPLVIDCLAALGALLLEHELGAAKGQA